MTSSRRTNPQRGASLIETLIALSLIAAALVFIFNAIGTFGRLNSRSESRSNAATAARTRLEQLRYQDPSSLPTTGSESTSAYIGTHHFTVITRYCENASYCDDGTRHVVVAVQEQGQDVFEAETVITQLR